jgi:hypothetical protein
VPEDPPNEEHVQEVVASGDVRDRQLEGVEYVGHDQEVDIASMRRNENLVVLPS